MFDPSKQSQAKLEALTKKRAQASVKEKCLQLVPMELQEGLLIDVKEVQCGDPNCSPIDTLISLVWTEGGTSWPPTPSSHLPVFDISSDYTGRGMFALPLSVEEIEEEDLLDSFPVTTFR
jgi:hypothetical protein